MTTQLTKPTSTYDQARWAKGYRTLKEEFDYDITDVVGEIPADLHGTLFRNGPGTLDVNGQNIHHPFDGDGMICAITFKDGQAHFKNRHIRTAGYQAEQKAGKILYRGVFGTARPGGWLSNLFDTQLKNIANTQVIYWGGKLLALWEAAEPHALNPATLETLGIDRLNNQLPAGTAFAAHPWIDPQGQATNGEPCLFNFGIQSGLSFTLKLFEIDHTGKIVQEQSHPLPGFSFIHDCAITPRYALFFQNPVRFNPLPFVFGLKGAAECINFRPGEPTRIMLFPRDGKAKPITVEAQSGFVFHHANAFEADDNTVVIDSIAYADLPAVEPGTDFRDNDFTKGFPGNLWRFRIDLTTGQVERQLLLDRCCEFPVIHPALVGRAYHYAYMGIAAHPTNNAPLQGIGKINVTTGETLTWLAGSNGYVNEPTFIPRQGAQGGCYTEVIGQEDDGWVVVMIYDGEKDQSAIVVLDARDLTQVARLNLKHHVPFGLHGTFTPEVFAAV
jgi:all-trans-8'-apo-beta-carotenal 15,15'-oxygenase